MLNYSIAFRQFAVEIPQGVLDKKASALSALKVKLRPIVKGSTSSAIDPKIAGQLADAERDEAIAIANLSAVEAKRKAAEKNADARAVVMANREHEAAIRALEDARELFKAASAIHARAVEDAQARAAETDAPVWAAINELLNAEQSVAEADIEKALVGPLSRLLAVKQLQSQGMFSNTATFAAAVQE